MWWISDCIKITQDIWIRFIYTYLGHTSMFNTYIDVMLGHSVYINYI